MTRTQGLIYLIFLPLFALAISACGSDTPAPRSAGTDTPVYSHAPDDKYDRIYTFNVETSHGTTECIAWKGYSGGGLDCDWPRR